MEQVGYSGKVTQKMCILHGALRVLIFLEIKLSYLCAVFIKIMTKYLASYPAEDYCNADEMMKNLQNTT